VFTRDIALGPAINIRSLSVSTVVFLIDGIAA
jgi:hypothetical protein